VIRTQLLHQVIQVAWAQVHDRGRLDGRAHAALLRCKGLRAGMTASSKVSCSIRHQLDAQSVATFLLRRAIF
jgi:hypothetical protein